MEGMTWKGAALILEDILQKKHGLNFWEDYLDQNILVSGIIIEESGEALMRFYMWQDVK